MFLNVTNSKSSFITPVSSHPKKFSLLKLMSSFLLAEQVQSTSKRMHMLFILFRSLSSSPEVVKEIMKLKLIEDLLSNLQPSK